ncbi:hypothetical protein NPIL_530311 [Nephila pilipes]|uniref:Uncharacterized protein n=1 Tax=Nephila pilipes TaxID=299642 RepID=A0A8X6MQY0_NEPPI|nr:hypothetical protein NPIL_530311 [Nephila pilipes]
MTSQQKEQLCVIDVSNTQKKQKEEERVYEGVQGDLGKKNPFPARGVVPSTPPIRKLARKEHKKKKKGEHWKGVFRTSKSVGWKEKAQKKKQCNSTRTRRGEKGMDTIGNMNPTQTEEIPGKVSDDFQERSREQTQEQFKIYV